MALYRIVYRYGVVIVNVSALKIHMSQDAHDALKEFPGFMIEPRGEIAVKVNSFSYNTHISAKLSSSKYNYVTYLNYVQYSGIVINPCTYLGIFSLLN